MKNYLNFLLGIIFLFICTNIFAQPVDINTAQQIAKTQIVFSAGKMLKSGATNQKNDAVSFFSVVSEKRDTLFYVFNDTVNKSFIIISADKRVFPILAYSTNGNFIENELPPSLSTWMNNTKKEIAFAIENHIGPGPAIEKKWQNLILGNTPTDSSFVEPLTHSKWDQSCYYNNFCPTTISTANCNHTPAGCLAISMAQLMKYWNFPRKGNGNIEYTSSTGGNLSVDFGATTYNWNEMPDKLDSQNDAVAELVYHCGAAVRTDYGPDGSNAALSPTSAFKTYFKYSNKAKEIYKDDYVNKISEWTNIIKSEIDSGRPVWYSGSGVNSHTFILDGYKDSVLFHINVGWGGYWDGYYLLDNVNPGTKGYTYNDNQSAIIKLFPSIPLPTANSGKAQNVEEGQLVELDGTGSSDPENLPLNYLWHVPKEISLSSDTDAKPTFTAPEVKKDTTLYLYLTVNNGEVNSIPSQVKVIVKNKTTDQVNSITTKNNSVYPNPTSGIVSIEGLTSTKLSEISVYSSDGRLLLRQNGKASSYKIDISKQLPGTFLFLIDGKIVKVIKK